MHQINLYPLNKAKQLIVAYSVKKGTYLNDRAIHQINLFPVDKAGQSIGVYSVNKDL